MPQTSININGISKKFKIRAGKNHNNIKAIFKESLHDYFPVKHEEFWALKDISFEIYEGESLGIIGMNGAGKSTLLKILSGIIKPSSGKIEISGTLAAILELGVGFHPELTGRDNIIMYGKILGFSHRQIIERYNDILEFSEIGDFIDNPVKLYSSGMLMRLGFAVIAFLETDIILLDEMLSVGDANFRSKCVNKIVDLKNKKRTIVIVGHDINEISNYCDRLVLIHKGSLISLGSPTEVISKYQEVLMAQKSKAKQIDFKKFKRDDYTTMYNQKTNALVNNYTFLESSFSFIESDFIPLFAKIYAPDSEENDFNEFDISHEIHILIKVKFNGGKGDFGFSIRDFMNNRLFGEFVSLKKNSIISEPGIYEFDWTIPANIFNEGIYKFGIVLFDEFYNHLYNKPEMLIFKTFDPSRSEGEYHFYTPVKPLIKMKFSKIG
jgi:ABC-type polysaccharide/polyol phosphate transport system ATPase subunit